MSAEVRFSIIVPVYNRLQPLLRAIQSVREQICNEWELILVDDGSEPAYRAFYTKLCAHQQIYLHHIDHGERSRARNYGAAQSRGKWICFLDSDDYLLPDYLSVFQNAIALNEEQKIYKAVQKLEGPINSINLGQLEISEGIVKAVWKGKWNLAGFCFPAVIFQNLHFPPKFSFWEDRHFLLRAIFHYPLEILGECTSVISDYPGRSVHTLGRVAARERSMDILNCMDDLLATPEGSLVMKELGPKAVCREKAYRSIGIANDALNAGKKNQARKLLIKTWKYLDFKTLPSWLNTWSKSL